MGGKLRLPRGLSEGRRESVPNWEWGEISDVDRGDMSNTTLG